MISTTMVLAFVATPSPAAPQFSVIYTFKGGSDAAWPVGGLARDSAGNLYGATSGGGGGPCHGGCGAIYRIAPDGTETVLHSFNKSDGWYPFPVVLDAAGNLYGMTLWGGDPTCNCGLAYKLDNTGKLTVLHTFLGGDDGQNPESPLVLDDAGNLYGTTMAGGPGGGCTNEIPAGCGVVFKLTPKGKETILHAFSGSDGANPSAGLLRDAEGDLFGSTLYGGTSDYGTLFEVRASGAFRTLHSFSGSGPDNGYPYDGLIEDGHGNLYGTTEWHPFGSNRYGTVFKLVHKDDSLETLFTFDLVDGGYPAAGLTRDENGNLYGTTLSGGMYQHNEPGVVFELTKRRQEIPLYEFKEGDDGYGPGSILVRDESGNLYGTALGGSNNGGVVFKITP